MEILVSLGRAACTYVSVKVVGRNRTVSSPISEQGEVAKALAQDANVVFLEKVRNTFVEDISLSDDEPEPDSMEGAESAGGRGVKAPPSYAELSSPLGHLEQHAESCGTHEAGHFLRKAKMRFLAAHAGKPARQSDIRSFTSS